MRIEMNAVVAVGKVLKVANEGKKKILDSDVV
jgi:hypothetical protein